MANKFGIPAEVEEFVRSRDRLCVYCFGKMKSYAHTVGSPKDKATIEHLSFNGPFRWNKGLQQVEVAICCQSCNSSRGDRRLTEWFKSEYCLKKNINKTTVAEPVKKYLRKNPDK